MMTDFLDNEYPGLKDILKVTFYRRLLIIGSFASQLKTNQIGGFIMMTVFLDIDKTGSVSSCLRK